VSWNTPVHGVKAQVLATSSMGDHEGKPVREQYFACAAAA
jgi:hypothetical protein